MAERDDAPRTPIGYRPSHRLGAGRTAIVYLAEHDTFGRVALKLPRPELSDRPLLRRMFENEVMITLRLDHPSVVKALAGHPTGERAFLALEICPGGTLDQLLLERGRLPLAKAVQLVEDVAVGLAYTHVAKVLHRDVKPANVFLSDAGRAKLGDFGTGTFMAEESGDRVGTAFYMAPEIFEGAPASVRSDVYSLGVLAFEVLTGERPFKGDTYDALMHAHMTGLVRDPRSLRDGLSSDLAQVVRTALVRLPERRFASVAAFLKALREATPEGREPEAQAPPDGRAQVGRSSRMRQDDRVAGGAPADPSNDVDAEDADESASVPWWRRLLGGGSDEPSS